MLNMAVLAPIPSARVRTVIAVNPGFLRKTRAAYRKSAANRDNKVENTASAPAKLDADRPRLVPPVTIPTVDTPFRLDGRTALVTGGASGIGEAVCRVLTAAGAAVTIVDIDAVRARSLAGELAGSSVLPFDITDAPAVN